MVNAGPIDGTFINAFAINEGAIVHVLSGTMTMGVTGTLDATRRAAIHDTMTIALAGTGTPHRRVAAPGTGTMVFSNLANISQRHAARAKGTLALKATVKIIRRRAATGNGVIRFVGTNGLHARRAAVASGRISLTQSKARVVRRQRAIGTGLITFLANVNLRAFAPVSGKDVMKFKETATAVRRVGLPAYGRIVLTGEASATARRQIITSDTMLFLSSIRMPHAHMTPTEEIRAMRVLEQIREMNVPETTDPIRVIADDREIHVPQRVRSVGNPDVEDPA
nr:hypothetical protein [Brucella anthropi]